MVTPLVIMPVKDALPMAERAIRAVVESGYSPTVYDDFSTPENAARLDALSQELGFAVIHLSDLTDHPSPNYRLVLIHAQKKALENGQDLVIIESDVLVRPKTIESLQQAVTPQTGMVAAVTQDKAGQVNFPYEYAKRLHTDGVCRKRLSFCCTLLTNALLNACDFEQLNPRKDWYDVHISHLSRRLGFENILQVSNPVTHIPHSSRPWKRLKYTNPLLYYWRKWILRRDSI